MSRNILYNVVRDNVPNSLVDDQGLMDIARQITGLWPTDVTRLRFVGFRYNTIAGGSSFNLNSNEIGLILSVGSGNAFTINATVFNQGNQVFGIVFNRIIANAVGSCAFQYALFTYQ